MIFDSIKHSIRQQSWYHGKYGLLLLQHLLLQLQYIRYFNSTNTNTTTNYEHRRILSSIDQHEINDSKMHLLVCPGSKIVDIKYTYHNIPIHTTKYYRLYLTMLDDIWLSCMGIPILFFSLSFLIRNLIEQCFYIYIVTSIVLLYYYYKKIIIANTVVCYFFCSLSFLLFLFLLSLSSSCLISCVFVPYCTGAVVEWYVGTCRCRKSFTNKCQKKYHDESTCTQKIEPHPDPFTKLSCTVSTVHYKVLRIDNTRSYK